MNSFEDSPTPYSPLGSGCGSGPDAHLVDKRGGDYPRARACRFRDLGEAHRNITGRSISAACSAAGGNISSCSTDNDHGGGTVSPRRNVTSPVTFGVTTPQRGTCVEEDELVEPVELVELDEFDEVDEVDDVDRIFGSSSPDTPVEPFSPLSPNHHRSSGSQMAMTVDSKDTTVRMYRQYQDLILSQPSPTPVPVLSTVYRPVSDSSMHYSMHNSMHNSMHDMCQLQLQDSPRGKTHSMAMSMPTRESLLYPKPLRVQSIRAEGKHASLYSGAAVSGTGMTTDSEDDPFRYDKDAYKIFLHPSKERDVSTALHHIGGGGSTNTHSQATLHGALKSQRNIGLVDDDDDDPFCSGPTRARSATPEDADGFYDTSVIQPSWAGERSEYEVKVVLQDVRNGMDESRFHRRERASLYKPHQHAQAAASQRSRRNKENAMPSSECGDWETVATSVPALVGMQSRADVSDSDSFARPFNEYASTDRIVQHPSGHGHENDDSEASLQICNVHGTKVPVMVPKQRVHRVNGVVQDACVSVSNPFRQLSGRRSRQFSPTPLHPLPYKLDKGRGKYEFQPSLQASDGVSLASKPVYEFLGVSSETGQATMSMSGGEGDDSHALRDSGSSQSSHRTMHSFPFPLIPLPQAAHMEAVRRRTVYADADAGAGAGVNVNENAGGGRRAYHRSPTAFFASLFSPSASTTQSSCYHAQRYSRLKKSRAVPNDLTVASTVDTRAGGSTWASLSGASQLLRSAATRLHLNDVGRKQPVGFAMSGSRGTPRLYPWDYPVLRAERRTDPELQAIALPARHSRMADLEWTGVPQDAEAFLSRDVRQQRQVWFYWVLAASAFPFISVLVYMGTFDSALSWFTRGEVSRLNGRQRRAILLVMVMQFVVWPIALGVVIWKTM